MREIKFRAWDRDTKEMLTEPDKIPIYYENDNGFHSGRENIHGEWTELKLMQYTGLKDSTNTEIYEGDILLIHKSCGRKVIAVCKFIDGCFEVESKSPLVWSNPYKFRDYLKCFTVNHAVEIIGNVYENPELLKGE